MNHTMRKAFRGSCRQLRQVTTFSLQHDRERKDRLEKITIVPSTSCGRVSRLKYVLFNHRDHLIDNIIKVHSEILAAFQVFFSRPSTHEVCRDPGVDGAVAHVDEAHYKHEDGQEQQKDHQSSAARCDRHDSQRGHQEGERTIRVLPRFRQLLREGKLLLFLRVFQVGFVGAVFCWFSHLLGFREIYNLVARIRIKQIFQATYN